MAKQSSLYFAMDKSMCVCHMRSIWKVGTREFALRKDLDDLVIVLNGLLEKAIVLIDRTGDLPKEAGLGCSRCQDVVAVEQLVEIFRRRNII
jgi:hypothetical protein